MKKQFSIFVAALALLTAVSSCSNDGDNAVPSGETGSLKLTIGFTPPKDANTRVASTVKPNTDWANNIKSLQLLLVNTADNKVAYAHDVVLGNLTAGASAAEKKYTILNTVPAGTYNMYLIANNGVAPTIATHYPGAAIGTATPIVRGTDLSTALMALTTNAGSNEAAGTVGVGQANELFWAKSAGTVTITADVTNTPAQLNLTRAVGLLRVRINKSHVNARAVKFTNADSPLTGFRIRNIGTSLKTSDMSTSAANRNNTLIALGGFKTAADFTAVSSTYSAGTMGVVADVSNVDDFTYWGEYLALPGGAASGAGRFEVVITGWANAGYVTASGAPLAAAGLVHWAGPVNAALAANGILELNVTITTPGIGGPTVPISSTYGDLTVDAKLIDWGAITSVNVPL